MFELLDPKNWTTEELRSAINRIPLDRMEKCLIEAATQELENREKKERGS